MRNHLQAALTPTSESQFYSPTLFVFPPTCRKDFELNQLQSKMEDEQSLYTQLQKNMKELQV